VIEFPGIGAMVKIFQTEKSDFSIHFNEEINSFGVVAVINPQPEMLVVVKKEKNLLKKYFF